MGVAGYFVGQTLLNGRAGDHRAEVWGLAERRVEADRAIWRVGYAVEGSAEEEVAVLYARSEENLARIIAVLTASGFEATEIQPGTARYARHEFRDEAQKLVDERHQITGSVLVETTKVGRVSEARARLNGLIAEGIDIQNGSPSYQFTRLNEIKPRMLAEAAANARVAASEFAANAGVTVGGILSARQGRFEIRDLGSSHSDTNEIQKNVRVVTSVVFQLGR
jgi:hypothetical protein